VADRLIHQSSIAGDRRLNRHFLDLGAQIGERGNLRWKRADVHGAEAFRRREDRHLDASVGGKIRHEIGVANVSVEFKRLSPAQSINDVGGVLVASFELDRALEPGVDFGSPIVLAPTVFVENVM
jgi:hypothetical protein